MVKGFEFSTPKTRRVRKNAPKFSTPNARRVRKNTPGVGRPGGGSTENASAQRVRETCKNRTLCQNCANGFEKTHKKLEPSACDAPKGSSFADVGETATTKGSKNLFRKYAKSRTLSGYGDRGANPGGMRGLSVSPSEKEFEREEPFYAWAGGSSPGDPRIPPGRPSRCAVFASWRLLAEKMAFQEAFKN